MMETWDIEEALRQYLKIEDFQLSISESRYPFLTKNEKNRTLQFGGGDLFKKSFNGLSCYVTFLNFENLSKPTNTEPEDLDSLVSMRPYIHNKLLPYDFGLNIFDQFPIVIKSIADVNTVSNLIEQFYYQDAKPFFEYWQDIRMFLPFLEEDNEAAIELLGNNYIIRKMTLWKLCNHPKYEEFVSTRISILENVLKEDSENEDYIDVLNTIKAKYRELREIQPDYNWNPDYLIVKPFKPNPV